MNGLKVHGLKAKREIKFVYWTIPESGRKKQKKLFTIEKVWQKHAGPIEEFVDYTVNGDYILLKYYTYPFERHEELWHMMDPAPVEIKLPNIALFWGKNGSADDRLQHGDGWIMDTNTNSQFLVRACKMEMIHSRENFVIVFSGFDAPKYLHRITTTTSQSSGLYHFIRLSVVGENANAKTLLMVEELKFNEFEEDKEMRVFDLSTAQRLFTQRYGEHSSFVCSRNTLWHKLSDIELDHVRAKLLWINWNGKDWSISETVVPLPVDGQKTTLRSVTETRILWDVEGEKVNYFISYDYLLPDRVGTLINTDKSTWLDNFYTEDYQSEDTDEEDDEDGS